MTKTRTEMREAYDDSGYQPPSNYQRDSSRDRATVDYLARLQQNTPSQHPTYDSDPFGHLAEDEAHRHRRARSIGGWVAPLQGAQFAGSPQADTQADAGDPGDGTGGDSGAAGDGGGTA